ncbi:MAG: hypothetical protein AB1632_09185 [Nitrospirota bacterium]
MSKKSVIILSILIIFPIIIYLLWPSDENRIKKLFREGAKAVENENIDDVMSKVSFNYSDEYGLTYLYIKEGMGQAFQRLDDIMIEYEIKNIEIKDKTAAAELDIRVIASSGNDAGYIIGDAAKPVHAVFSLEKVRTKWLVIKTKGIPLYF